MTDIEWYRSFVAVYQTGTVTAAAQRCAMTQPAISQHLAALEKTLGIQLFHRAPRRMIPTASGKELYSQVIAAIEKLESIDSLIQFRVKSQPTMLRVGTPKEFFHEIGLDRLAKTVNVGYRIWLSFGETTDLIARLEKDELDVVIATQKVAAKHIHYSTVKQETFVIIAPKHLMLPTGLSTTQMEAWLNEQDWISYGPDLPIIRRYWQMVFGGRPNILPKVIIPDLLTIIRAVELGLGLSIVPTYLCRRALEEQRISMLSIAPQEIGNQLYVACRPNRLHNAEIEWLTGLLNAYSNEKK